ncbi:SURF1 family protein [Nitzschia inconspicua]|uniref:SURF1-like protein n=1 Tax=Nitzschia inconspicua TaxID=303405 RepID=A0A9K3K6L6_9STRA|nr:SURF1 family protein [Nitzschia inconspicua]KAG7371260.1 SURF1 family protein [Nitzschia inconspicua]
MTASSVPNHLSTSGKVFFASLCAGTFGLGVWQVERLVEKLQLIDERQAQLDMEPVTQLDASQQPYRRRLLQGTFRHDKEVLIGPRGAPPGVYMPVQGLSAMSGKSSSNQQQGMSSGPQGYHVLTPLELADGTADRRMVWVNRGWVPKNMVPGGEQPYRRQGAVEAAKIQQGLSTIPPKWTRPTGAVKVTAVQAQVEKPKFITPEHDYSRRPLQLFWLDGLALQAIAESNEETYLMTQVLEEEKEEETEEHQQGSQAIVEYPLRPPITSVGDFRTTPAIHVGYAATWFGLSAAGVYMTRKLITKGRF